MATTLGAEPGAECRFPALPPGHGFASELHGQGDELDTPKLSPAEPLNVAALYMCMPLREGAVFLQAGGLVVLELGGATSVIGCRGCKCRRYIVLQGRSPGATVLEIGAGLYTVYVARPRALNASIQHVLAPVDGKAATTAGRALRPLPSLV